MARGQFFRPSRLIAAVVLAAATASPSDAQQPAASVQARFDPAAEVASAVFYMSTVVDALKAEHGAELKLKNSRIVALQDELKTAKRGSAEAARLRDELSQLQKEVVDQLSAKDAELARQIAAFRDAVQDIASTSQGLEILAQRRPGNLRQARELLIALEAGMAAAEQRTVNIRSATRLRSIATLSLDDKDKGEATTEEAIALFERVVALDGLNWDWIELGRLYQANGNLAKAADSARRASAVALNGGGRGAAFQALGDVLLVQGDTAGALKAYRDGQAILEHLVATEPESDTWRANLSVSLTSIGNVLVARGDGDGALSAYQESLEIRERLAAAAPDDDERQQDLASSLRRVGAQLLTHGDNAGALEALQESLAIESRLSAADPDNAVLQRGVMASLNTVGDGLARVGDNAGALEAYRGSAGLAAHLVELDPGNVTWTSDLSLTLMDVASMLELMGDKAGALGAYREGLGIVERLAAGNPNNVDWQRDLALAWGNIGDVLAAEGDTAGALEAFSGSLAIVERLAAADPDNAAWQRDRIIGNINLADATGDRSYYVRALQIAEEMSAKGVLRRADAGIIPMLKSFINKQ